MESQSSQTDDKWEDIEMKGVKTICSCNHVNETFPPGVLEKVVESTIYV